LPDVKVRDFSVCMKKIITTSCFSLSIIALLAIVGTQTACHKDSTNCTAVITVDSAGSLPVSGASVKLYAPHGISTTGTSDAAGKVTFTYTLPAILNISVTKAMGTNDTLKGTGIIQLQIGQTISTTVTIK
jgi:hypothetical protein